MSQFDTTRNILQARIIYWGPTGAGKTASLERLCSFLDAEGVHLYSIAGRDGATFLFDLLPIPEFRFGPCRVRARVVATPGSPARSVAREMLLREADAVVFTADARRSATAANRASFVELQEAIARAGLNAARLPLVVALNHADAADRIQASDVTALLGRQGVPVFECVAADGRGVFEAFSEATRLMIEYLVEEHGIVGVDAEGAVPTRLLTTLARGAAAPGTIDDRRIVLEVDAGAPHAEAAAVQAQLGAIEAHVVAATSNENLERRNRELMAVNRVARSLLSAMEADNLLVVLLDATADFLAVSYASCVLFDPTDTGALRTHVLGFGRDPVLGLPQEAAARFFELLRGSDGPVPASAKYNPSLLKALQRVDRRVKRAMFQPIKSDHGKPAGWIGIYAAGDEPALTTQEILFLSSISRLAALGLEKIAMLERTQRFGAEQERLLRERTGQLEMASAKVRALNRGLESRVSERTRGLEEANRKLKDARASAVHNARLRGMGQLAASFAHEVNNPVAGLNANLEYMRDNLDELRARIAAAPEAAAGLQALDEFEEIIAESRSSAQRVADIIASLKRFGGEEERSERFSLNAVVADAVTLIEERLNSCAELDLHLNQVPDIEGDDLELRHVVLALLTNAVEAIERSVRRGRITLTSFSTQGKVTLAIKDTGVGVDPALLPRVFEPFVSSKDGESGAGLGLHCAYKTIKLAGGTIRLRSKPQDGTTVTVVLPVEKLSKVEA